MNQPGTDIEAKFETVILKFGQQGEKTGWTFIEIPADISEALKPGCRKSFRVKGKLDQLEISGMALIPMGDGNFILPLKAQICRKLGKREGAVLQVSLAFDQDFRIEVPEDLLKAFGDDSEAIAYFNAYPPSHRHYFIKWINDAKTAPTRIKRIVKTVNAAALKISYGEMIRRQKNFGL